MSIRDYETYYKTNLEFFMGKKVPSTAKKATKTSWEDWSKYPDSNKKLWGNWVEARRASGLGYGALCKLISIGKFYVTVFEKKKFEKADRVFMEKVINKLKDKKFSKETEIKYRHYVKMFYRWVYDTKKIEYKKDWPDLVDWIGIKRGVQENLEPEDLLTRSELVSIIENTMNDRDKAFFAMLADTGARPHELFNLKIKNFTIKSNRGTTYYQVSIGRHGKTKERKVTCIWSMPYVAPYLGKVRITNGKPNDLFFSKLSDKTVGLNIDNMNKALKSAAKKLGIEKRVYLYLLRHTSLTEQGKKKKSASLSYRAGWTQGSKMAQRYIHLSADDDEEATLTEEGFEPENKKQEVTIICPSCRQVVGTGKDFCNCGASLTVRGAELIEKQNKKLDVQTKVGGLLMELSSKDNKNKYTKEKLAELLKEVME